MLTTIPSIFSISILVSCLNILSLLLPNLLQTIERTNFSLKMYDILEFLHFMLFTFKTIDFFIYIFNKFTFFTYYQ